MRNKIISCLLSVTLILNCVLAYTPAFAEELAPNYYGEAVTEGSSSDGLGTDIRQDSSSSVDDLLLDSGGLSVGVSSSGQGAETGEESSNEVDATPTFLSERETPEYTNPNSRALPAVLTWLIKVGVSSAGASAIHALLGNSSQEEEDLLYGILEALVEDGWTAAEYLKYIESYAQSCMAHLNNIYYQLRYTNSAGNTYSVGRMLYELWDLTEEIPGYLYYTNEKGYTYDVAAMIYDIWDTLYRMEAVEVEISKFLPDYLKYTNSSGYTYDLAYMVYQLWDILYYMDTGGSSSENPGFPGLDDLISEVQKIYDHLLEDDDEVEVKVDVEGEQAATLNLWELLFGALEFGLIATSISDLGDTMQTTFPFSLVAGFVAIIGLLQAEPVAPSFDFPMPDGVGGTVEYTVDLAPFNDVAAAFRVLITIVFILGLIGITRNFIFKGGSSE